MKMSKVFHCQAIALIFSILFLLVTTTGCLRVVRQGVDCNVTVITEGLPDHNTSNWGITVACDTLICYEIESGQTPGTFDVHFYKSNDRGKLWTPSGKIELKSNPAFPFFSYYEGKAIFAFSDCYPELTDLYEEVYVSTNGCEEWNLVKKDKNKVFGARFNNKNCISVLELESTLYTVSASSDMGSSWDKTYIKVPTESIRDIHLDDENVIYSENNIVKRQSITDGRIDTIYVGGNRYPITDLICNGPIIGFCNEMKESVILCQGKKIEWRPNHWKSTYMIPIYTELQDSLLYITIRDLSITKPKCRTYAIDIEGETVYEICDGRIDCTLNNDAFRITKDHLTGKNILKRYTINQQSTKLKNGGHSKWL